MHIHDGTPQRTGPPRMAPTAFRLRMLAANYFGHPCYCFIPVPSASVLYAKLQLVVLLFNESLEEYDYVVYNYVIRVHVALTDCVFC